MLHLILTVSMFQNSKMLTDTAITKESFQNRISNVSSAEEALDLVMEQPGWAKLYIAFFVISLVLYLVNLFICNPTTMCCKLCICINKRRLSKAKKSKQGKDDRIKSYLNQSQDLQSSYQTGDSNLT